jgi:hypothetical protein
VNGTLKTTIRPRARLALASSSSKLRTTSASAWIPCGGVPTLLPSPSIAMGRRAGSTISTLSRPRTHLGTITGSA